ncbi:ACP phosphodiesterase [Penaeicola halotolerans]|uniref:acyl carrier protein phosphodiesterase n=1 Tax=Penaeicola halotolerans TaxID=2793196 RepID=UPI001CF8E868|nr:ACP phosphodiesterase [Penaeicola halotolerans]
MNFLAHAYLSFDQPKILVGNFLGDFIKGNPEEQFEAEIVKGVKLHRAIDEYTDLHPIVSGSKSLIREEFRHYAGVVIDVFYDYFLATNWSTYHTTALAQYTQEVYKELMKFNQIIPVEAKHMLSYMIPQNWLLHYGTHEGIKRSLSGLARRTTFDSGMENAHLALIKHENQLTKDFNAFFPELVIFARDYLKNLNQTL